jgi:hypothetical protein
MKFWIPAETPKEFCRAVEAAVAASDPPARVSVEEMRMPGHVLVTVSKLGTTTMEIELRSVEGEIGMYGEVVEMYVASFHKPFIDMVMAWVEKDVIEKNGGRLLKEN